MTSGNPTAALTQTGTLPDGGHLRRQRQWHGHAVGHPDGNGQDLRAQDHRQEHRGDSHPELLSRRYPLEPDWPVDRARNGRRVTIRLAAAPPERPYGSMDARPLYRTATSGRPSPDGPSPSCASVRSTCWPAASMSAITYSRSAAPCGEATATSWLHAVALRRHCRRSTSPAALIVREDPRIGEVELLEGVAHVRRLGAVERQIDVEGVDALTEHPGALGIDAGGQVPTGLANREGGDVVTGVPFQGNLRDRREVYSNRRVGQVAPGSHRSRSSRARCHDGGSVHRACAPCPGRMRRKNSAADVRPCPDDAEAALFSTDAGMKPSMKPVSCPPRSNRACWL